MRIESVLITIENSIKKLCETSGKGSGLKTYRVLRTVENIICEIRKDSDKRFAATTAVGMAANFLIAVFNAVLGLVELVSWYGTLSAYYFLIFAAKLYLLLNREKTDHQILTAAGRFLLAISLVIGGTVALIATHKGEKQYTGLILCVVAAYTFCKIVLSVFNLHKSHLEQNVFQFTLRKINHADSLMSLLYLQTGVFFAVGDANSLFSRLFNAIVGGLVWCIIFANAIELFVRQNRFKPHKENVECSCENGHLKDKSQGNPKKRHKKRSKKKHKKQRKKNRKKTGKLWH